MAAHALRNPLSVIRMAATTLQHPRIDEEMRGAQHAIIHRQGAYMARLIEDLLDGSRVGAGEFRLQCSALDLCAIVRESIDACRHAIDSKQQQLRVDLAPRPATVHGDPQRLTQVFSNLLNNASRRSHPGGDILVAMSLGAEQVVVTVADRGVGIAPEELPHIFDLFAVDTSVPVDESGLGIGLAVVYELVRAHGGTVAASSAGRDLGSEFIVRLPLASAAAA
jgi:diguanylate cyclase